MSESGFENLQGDVLRFRVSAATMQRLQAGAAWHGAPSKSAYARKLLDERLKIDEELMNLRRILLDRADAHSSSNESADPINTAAVIETLLLLRALVEPKTLRAAHADMQRMQIQPLRSA
jgi:hypothetical protein